MSKETNQIAPTESGMIRYPYPLNPGYYDSEPCTCTPECDENCIGLCGCAACSAAWSDATDVSYRQEEM